MVPGVRPAGWGQSKYHCQETVAQRNLSSTSVPILQRWLSASDLIWLTQKGPQRPRWISSHPHSPQTENLTSSLTCSLCCSRPTSSVVPFAPMGHQLPICFLCSLLQGVSEKSSDWASSSLPTTPHPFLISIFLSCAPQITMPLSSASTALMTSQGCSLAAEWV